MVSSNLVKNNKNGNIAININPQIANDSNHKINGEKIIINKIIPKDINVLLTKNNIT